MLVALLTPPGRGGIAVLHVCGEGARSLVRRLFPREFGDRPVAGRLELEGELLDEVLVRSAEGFTGEETVEVSCHGGAASVERVTRAFESLGARRADAAELLEHGVETGRLDRPRAEAWALLPRAATELAARVLADQSEGALSRAVESMDSVAAAERLLATSVLGVALASPRKVVLAGAPNAGKSTLFNALVRADRALVSPDPGTTRDPVRQAIAIDQVPLELVDTAGVGAPGGLLEQLSTERTAAALREADLIVFLFDAEAGARGDELGFLERLAERRVLLVVNKVDAGKKRPLLDSIPVSARTGEGLDQVRRRIIEALEIRPLHVPGRPVVFTRRQQELLLRAVTGRAPLEGVRRELLRGRI
jgi:tRNA modification GTPase